MIEKLGGKKINCPECQSNKNRSNGKTRYGKPRYLCKDCGRSFTDSTGSLTGRPKGAKKRSPPVPRTIHYKVPGFRKGSFYVACGVSNWSQKAKATNLVKNVTCKSCKKTILFKNHRENG